MPGRCAARALQHPRFVRYFALAFCFSALAFVGCMHSARGDDDSAGGHQSTKRDIPDYDGLGRPDAKADNVGAWLARILLSPLWFTTQYGLREPAGAVTKPAEKRDLAARVYHFFAFGPNHSIGIIPWNDVARDFVTLGASVRPWEDLEPVRGHEIFGYYQLDHFDPEQCMNEYPNVAWSRMTERDAAWMARILARFTPEMIHALAEMGDFSDPAQTAYIEHVMDGRLSRVLERWLGRLSPIGELRIDGDELCGVDMAEMHGLRAPGAFRYSARVNGAPLSIARAPRGRVCAALRRSPEQYVRVEIEDGFAKAKLVAHVYDLGDRGFELAGVERPTP